MYYALDYESFSEDEASELPRPTIPGRETLAFDEGVLVREPPKKIVFAMTADEHGEIGDYVLTGLPGLVISAKFRQALEGAGVDNVQYVSAEIRDETTKKTYADYFVANVIGVVDCIDIGKSKLTMRAAFPDKIRDINELHIDESRTTGLTLFRLGRWTSLVLASERLKRKLEVAKLRGVGLVPAEGYSI